MKKDIIRLSGPTQKDSIVDGEGLRTVIWFQGCPHHCPGCHNPISHDFSGGSETKISDVIEDIDNLKIQEGITFSGGEPMSQPEALLILAKHAKEKKLNVWCYSGYTFEEIQDMGNNNPIYIEILNSIDVLIDGKFILELKSLDLQFKGSSNQRIIDVKKSLKNNNVILIPKYKKTKSASKNRLINHKTQTLFI